MARKNKCTISLAYHLKIESKHAKSFQKYHLDNFDEMPCFRRAEIGENYFEILFYEEALPFILYFCEEHNIKLEMNENFKESFKRKK